PGSLRFVQAKHHLEPAVLFLLEDHGAFVFSRSRNNRFRAHEMRRHDDLAAQNKVVDDRMMAVELPPPGLDCRGLAHDRDVIEPFAQEHMVAGQLGKGLVQAHYVASKLEPPGAEGSRQEAKGGTALGLSHLLEADSLANVEVLVHPFAPFWIVHRKHGPGSLFSGERGEELLGGIADGLGRDAGGMDWKQPWNDVTIGGESFERLSQPFL